MICVNSTQVTHILSHSLLQIFLLKLHVSNLQVPIVLKVSGSTATVAVIVGWDLLVASVGDSEAYLDTGAEVIQVSSPHLQIVDNRSTSMLLHPDTLCKCCRLHRPLVPFASNRPMAMLLH